MPSNDFNRPCLSINTVPVTTSLMTIRSRQSWQKDTTRRFVATPRAHHRSSRAFLIAYCVLAATLPPVWIVNLSAGVPMPTRRRI
jgi:hypothetical protein